MPVTKDGITLESNDEALGVVENASETSSAAAADADRAETSPESETGNESDEQRKPKGGFQRKIDKLTRRATQLQEALEEERLARYRLEAQMAGRKPAEVSQTADDDPEPDETGNNPKTGKPWENWKQFNRAHTEWVIRQTSSESAETSALEDEREAMAEVLEQHTARVREAREKYDDWDDLAEQFMAPEYKIQEGVQLALMELDNSTDVIYHLAKNPDLLKQIQGLSELKAIAKIGAIADKLAEAKKPADQDKDSRSQTRTSSAPAPIATVSGANTRGKQKPGEMSLDEYFKGRNAGTIK